MSLTEIERRLTETEHGLLTTCDELRRLTEINRRTSRTVRVTQVGTVALVAITMMLLPAETTDAQSPHRVQAPFEVMGKNGKPLVRMVEPGTDGLSGGIYIYNNAGKIISMIGFTSESKAGRVAVYKGDQDSSASIREQASLLFSDDKPTLLLRPSPGTGLEAQPRAIHLINTGKHSAVSLNIQEDGSGQVELGDPTGQTVVDAKVLPTNGVGAVVTGPAFGGAMGLTGLPWAIVGKKAR